MKAKRIVSILLTGSMLLSLLPVSALAAAPVFDAPAQTTAKKAAARSSRDLDAENGTAENITTIHLNAEGKPESRGDTTHWIYYAEYYRLVLNKGTFTLQPSSDSGAESALQAKLYIDEDAEFNGGTVGSTTFNDGTISGGTFQATVTNDSSYDIAASKYISGVISGGIFQGEVYNSGTISNGTFQGILHNDSGTISGGTFKEAVEVNAASGTEAKIEGGTFEKIMTLQNSDRAPITIKGGLFDGEVVAGPCDSLVSITGGLFTKNVDVSRIPDPNNRSITGGYFVNKPTLPEGSGTRFTTVSDQAGRAFQVPVNGDWSESYTSLYVPCGSSEQHNTITVKTHTKLLYYLADGKRFPVFDSDSDNYIFEIPVRNNEKIVLVTEEPSAPPTDNPGGELDPEFSPGAAALSVVLGTAGLGYLTYAHVSSLYLYYTLPGGFIPSTRQELATVLWTAAGKPDPVSTALYTDIPADAIEQQKAARWCVEQGLMSDHGETFGPDVKVYNARIIRAWNSLKKLPMPITK